MNPANGSAYWQQPLDRAPPAKSSSVSTLGRRHQRVGVENDRQAVLAGADDHDLRIGRLRELKSDVDAAPAQVGIGNALADRLLEGRNAVCLNLFAFRLLGFTLDPEFVLLNHVELRSLRIDGIDHRRGQVDAE